MKYANWKQSFGKWNNFYLWLCKKKRTPEEIMDYWEENGMDYGCGYCREYACSNCPLFPVYCGVFGKDVFHKIRKNVGKSKPVKRLVRKMVTRIKEDEPGKENL